MAQLIDAAETTPAASRLAQLVRELAPVGLLQTMLVEQIARGMGRLALADAREDANDPADPKWARYQAQAERSFYRALTEFRRAAKADAKARAAEAAADARDRPAPAPSTSVVAGRRPLPEAPRPSPRPPAPAILGLPPAGPSAPRHAPAVSACNGRSADDAHPRARLDILADPGGLLAHARR